MGKGNGRSVLAVRDDHGAALEQDGEVAEHRGSPASLESVTRAQIDVQIATAKQYPRSVKRFMDDAQTLATLNREVAQSCYYVLPRDGKKVTGPSVRLAEIVASSWGNLRFGGVILEDMGDRVKVQGFCLDVEKNNGVSIEVVRRITRKDGRRFSEDMVTTTINAAISIAIRNAIFKVVPNALVEPLYQAAMRTAAGDEKSFAELRDNWMAFWEKRGVSRERVFRALGVRGVEDLDFEHNAIFAGLANSIKDKQLTVEEAFPAWKPAEEVRTRGASGLADRLTRESVAIPSAEPAFEPGTSGRIATEADEVLEPEGREPGDE